MAAIAGGGSGGRHALAAVDAGGGPLHDGAGVGDASATTTS